MSKVAFRWLVVATFAIPAFFLIADFTFLAHLMPPDLKAAMDRQVAEEAANPSTVSIALFAAALAVVLALPFQIYGLLRFRAWAPKFGIWLSVASYGLMPFYGAALYSGITATTMSLGSALWGIVVVLPYVSPQVRSYFWPGCAEPLSDMKTAGYEVGNG
ncbi:MAG: hypothetical protein EOO27_30095 [Comamonadaceae bacterium]|nr:MAG: hypothetical protein EOO27_30095 [Comamonadaceae bacterium]